MAKITVEQLAEQFSVIVDLVKEKEAIVGGKIRRDLVHVAELGYGIGFKGGKLNANTPSVKRVIDEIKKAHKSLSEKEKRHLAKPYHRAALFGYLVGDAQQNPEYEDNERVEFSILYGKFRDELGY